MSAEVLILALAQVVCFFLVGHVVIALALTWVGPRDEFVRRIGAPERWLLACLGFVVWAVLVMVVHRFSGGALFASPWPVPLATLALVALFVVRETRRPAASPVWRLRMDAKRLLGVLVAALVLVSLYALPAIEGGSSLRTGDPPWHLGWTEQLLGGEPVPVGPAPAFTANAYPWGLHAVLATLVRSVPGSGPLIAHEALHLLLIVAIPLAAACLARLVNRRAGWAAAAAASLIGGFGWIEAGGADFIVSPSEARYGADLVVASPNSVYELLPPGLPRELGLVLLACAAVLLAAALRERGLRVALLAGIGIGIVGLVSVPMFVSAIAWSAMAFLLHRIADRRLGVIIGSALVTFALWAAPVAADYVRYDGFVNVSPRIGVEWPLPTALGSWGLLLPLAVAGLVLTFTQPPVIARDVGAFCLAAVALIGFAIARGHFDWGVFGNETLLHQGRYWPPAHLLGAALAGVALTVLFGWRRRIGPVLAAGVVALGAISPVYASIDLTRTIRERRGGFLYGSSDLAQGSFVRQAAARLDPDDVIRAEDDDLLLAIYLFQFSGARIAANAQTDPAGNPWRVRFKELAERWSAFEEEHDFEVDYRFTKRESTPDALISGTFRGERWEMSAITD